MEGGWGRGGKEGGAEGGGEVLRALKAWCSELLHMGVIYMGAPWSRGPASTPVGCSNPLPLQ